MEFIKYIFSFLYVRNWQTGQKELSRARMAILFGGLCLILLALTMISILQAPVTYTR
jgi:hypothetical protein